MGTFHMGIMLHFNNADRVSFKELLENTKLPDKELQKQLQSLVDTKMISCEVCAKVLLRVRLAAYLSVRKKTILFCNAANNLVCTTRCSHSGEKLIMAECNPRYTLLGFEMELSRIILIIP